MSYDTNLANDSATGLDESEWHEVVEQAVSDFNDAFNPRGYEAELEWLHGGDFVIYVTLDGGFVATIYDNLNDFERVAHKVDEGDYEGRAA